MAHWGVPSGHDFDFHVSGWYDAAWQWSHGTLYPRMARWADFGAGEPRFVFYPPLSWMWGAALTHVISPRLIAALYCVTVMSFAGAGAWVLTRRWHDGDGAWWAAAAYVLNPYAVILVYWRSAFAEMLGMALLPWVVLAFLRVRQSRSVRDVALFALAFASVWLANTPSALLLSYLVALIAFCSMVQLRSWKVGLAHAGGVMLGLCVTAFYLCPALYEQRWLDLTQVLEPSLSPRNNVLFSNVGDPDFLSYNHLVSWVAVSLLVSSIVALLAAWRGMSTEQRTVLGAMVGAGLVLLLPISVSVWEHLPKLRFVQFPWRYSFVLAFCVAMLVGATGWKTRMSVLVLMWTSLFAMLHTKSVLYWTGADDAAEFRDQVNSAYGYEGIWDYAPAGVSIDHIAGEDPEVAFRYGSARTLGETIYDRRFEVNARRPGLVRIEVLDYPAWHLSLDGAAIANAHDDSGRVVVRVLQGEHRIEAVWQEPKQPRMVGAAISAIALCTCAGLIWRKPQASV
ncbi:MAG: hypothetical protein NVS9B15_16600 [Acidobacteriaceae bacterium]